ncbi:carboxyl transferase, partial [Pyronema domesticum]
MPNDDSASARLSQLSAQLKPADWSDISDHIETIETIARTPNLKSTGYIRQKSRGKLWVRERIDQLLDKDTFREIGSLTGTATWGENGNIVGFIPSNNVQGEGKVEGRKVLVTADDYSVRAGHADGALLEKTIYVEKLALQEGIPIIKLVDGSSGGGSVTTTKTSGYTHLPSLGPFFSPVVKQLDAGIPNIAALLGPVVGLGASRAAISHFSVISADIGYLFAAGPKIAEAATFEEDLSFSDLGGAALHCSNGTIDNLAKNEQDCFAQIRQFLSYLPSCGDRELPPFVPCSDPADRKSPDLNSLIPRRAARSFDIYTAIHAIVDSGSFFEIGHHWGRTTIVGLARLGGYPVGVLASDGTFNGGALDSLSCQKISKHLKLCDVYNLPLVQLLDCPGFAVGTAAEKAATMRWGVDMARAYYSTTMPIFSVIVRRCYGVAGGIMADARDVRSRCAWPSAEWGSLPLQGGVEVAHKAEIQRGDTTLEKLTKEYEALGNPVRTATRWGMEEMIKAEDSRERVTRWTRECYEGVLKVRVQERMVGRVKCSF